MQALVLDTAHDRRDQSLIGLMEAGVHVTGTACLRVAETCITRMNVDLLIMERDTMGDALGDLLGMAEERNPLLVSILRTGQVEADHKDLTPSFQSLHCVVGCDMPNDVAITLGLASLRALASRSARTARATRFKLAPTPDVAPSNAVAQMPMFRRAPHARLHLAEAV